MLPSFGSVAWHGRVAAYMGFTQILDGFECSACALYGSGQRTRYRRLVDVHHISGRVYRVV